MSGATLSNRLTPEPDEFAWLGLIVSAELLLLGAYFGLTPATVTSVRYVLYPFVWINLAIWALFRVDPPAGSDRARFAAGTVAAGYFLLLALLSGLVALELGAGGHSHSYMSGWQVTMSAPGWGPRIGYVASNFHVNFVPYRVVGYLGLAYLVYATLLEAAGAAISGVVGLVSCIGCTFPVVESVAFGLLGAGAAAATTTYAVDTSTAMFALAVVLLVAATGR